MNRPQSLPAKLMMPRIKKPLIRERLLALLDDSDAAVWIQGPPGAGKTSLIASYFQARGQKALWYRIDTDDREPGTFFHFLAEASAAILSRRSVLPAIGTDTRADWPAFARRFARALYAALPDGMAFCFDNVHDGGPALESILAVFAAELNERHRMVLISYHAPPAAFVELIAKRQLAVIGNDALRFTASETLAFARSMGAQHDSDIERIHALGSGWAAGIVLLALQRPTSAAPVDPSSPPALVLEYISTHLVQWMPERTRDIVSRCAFFPDFNAALACAASGDADAGAQIALLHREGFFVEQHGSGAALRYLLHSLLAEAVKNRIGVPGSAARQAAEVAAAHHLLRIGRVDAAITLLLAAGAFAEAAPCIIKVAKTLIASGREEQLAAWIAALPEALYRAQPWLAYWRANALAAFDEVEARKVFEAVHGQFQNNADQRGLLLTTSSILIALNLSWRTYEGIDRWVNAFESLWDADYVFVDAEEELRAVIGVFVAANHNSALIKHLDKLTDRLPDLITASNDAGLAHYVGTLVLDHLRIRREYERGLTLAAFIETRISLEHSNPQKAARWLASLGQFYVRAAATLTRRELLGRAAVRRKQAAVLIHRHDLLEQKISLAHSEADAAMQAMDISLASASLAAADLMLLPTMHWQLAWQASRKARLNLLEARPRDALACIRRAIAHAERAHAPAYAYAVYFQTAAICLAWMNQFDDADQEIKHTLAMARDGPMRIAELTALFFFALREASAAPEPSPEGCSRIAQFFIAHEAARIAEFGNFMLPLLQKLCAVALQCGILPDKVTHLIQHKKLLPPATATDAWPWPVRIHALGGFQITLWGEAMVSERKSQKKPIEMLQFLVATHHPARPLEGEKIARVIDELWPDQEAADPKGSFDTTLHRLRKLLGHDDAVLIGDACVKLNRDLVWCDAFDFATAAANCETPVDLAAAVDRYRGAFLGKAASAPWAFARAERLAMTFVDLVLRRGAELEASNAPDLAIALYQRAIIHDNLIEAFYRGLMRCHIAKQEPAEAMRAYRRAREILHLVLGVNPSQETERLRRQLPA